MHLNGEHDHSATRPRPDGSASAVSQPAPRSTWVMRALLVVAVVLLLENARPLLLPVMIARRLHVRARRRRCAGCNRAASPSTSGAALVIALGARAWSRCSSSLLAAPAAAMVVACAG